MQLTGKGCVEELENKIASFYGMKHALCVSNATTGLLGIALAVDLRNTEFITSPYTYGGTVSSWLMLGNTVVFVDIEPAHATIDTEQIGNAITRNTRAILATDILGNPSHSEELRRIADEYGLWYIADAAQSLGASRDGMPASVYADALVISFTAGKTLFAGEGGAIITNNTALYERLIWTTQHPFRQQLELGLNVCNEFGINGRIHPFAANYANANFDKAISNLQRRQVECTSVIELLESHDLIEKTRIHDENILPSFFRLTVVPKMGIDNSDVVSLLKFHGIDCVVSNVPVSVIYQHPAFSNQWKRQNRLANCYEAERQAKERVCLNLIQSDM
ncbi:MAG: aminotransferase class V-fold PLP-dependent enzyme [Acidobacteria bacterium]|nr:aminotransferase class V-fold PLP-dependent enzyme [Acidobacteriota bacterium]